jgi:hypothetical protein
VPNRVIRGELLNSERYWSVGLEGRQLFVHLILVADDFGLVNGTSFSLRRTCFGPDGCDAKRLESLLSELTEHGLVVPYTVRDVRYLWIPRFGNFPRAHKSRFPVCASIFNELAKELQCIRHADDLHVQRVRTAAAPETETETETEKKEPPSEGAVAPSPGDPKKAVFDAGVALLAKQHGDKDARSLVGRMRKALGDSEVLELIRKAGDATEPVEWLMKAAAKATISKRISDANGGAKVVALSDGRFRCGEYFYSRKGDKEVAI